MVVLGGGGRSLMSEVPLNHSSLQHVPRRRSLDTAGRRSLATAPLPGTARPWLSWKERYRGYSRLRPDTGLRSADLDTSRTARDRVVSGCLKLRTAHPTGAAGPYSQGPRPTAKKTWVINHAPTRRKELVIFGAKPRVPGEWVSRVAKLGEIWHTKQAPHPAFFVCVP
ncbi:hypothetical protein T484DRAFT_2227797 [Baffinella frigidus]|nr:hypothetical protein T484DRAFT_2227797 [Cryptophyta sp. CCMP2293]